MGNWISLVGHVNGISPGIASQEVMTVMFEQANTVERTGSVTRRQAARGPLKEAPGWSWQPTSLESGPEIAGRLTRLYKCESGRVSDKDPIYIMLKGYICKRK